MNRWERYGLLVLLAEKIHEHNCILGKTALQKRIYLAKVLSNIDLPPICRTLSLDI